MTNEITLLLFFFTTIILGSLCIALFESRNFWRKKWEEEFFNSKLKR